MNHNASYSKHPQPTLWSPVMGMFHGMERSTNGCNPEGIPSRLESGNDPMEAGR